MNGCDEARDIERGVTAATMGAMAVMAATAIVFGEVA